MLSFIQTDLCLGTGFIHYQRCCPYNVPQLLDMRFAGVDGLGARRAGALRQRQNDVVVLVVEQRTIQADMRIEDVRLEADFIAR